MKFPNWFKIVWWVLLLVGLGVILTKRYNELITGKLVGSDVLVLVVWLALLLLPLFQEISLFGLTFKKEFETLKTNVRDEVSSIRSEIRNSVDIRTQISPNFVFPPPPPDSQLPAIEKSIRGVLEAVLNERDISHAAVSQEVLAAPPDAELLFRARYNMERELRRIWQHRAQESAERRFMPTLRIAQSLVEWELINPGVERAIREVWVAASPAIHGEPVTPAKVAFVRDVAPQLVAFLKTIN
jgi:hypothetical protein